MQVGDLSPTEFERLSALLDEALAHPPARRETWLAELASRDPQVAAQLGELLEVGIRCASRATARDA